MAKIYTFPTSGKVSAGASWLHRLVCGFAYVGVAYLSSGGFSFWLFVLLGLAYYATIYLRRWTWASSVPFTRYHLLQAILLFFIATLVGQLLLALLTAWVALGDVLLQLPLVSALQATPLFGFNAGRFPVLWAGIIQLLGIYSFVMVLMGKEHRFPLVSGLVDSYQWR